MFLTRDAEIQFSGSEDVADDLAAAEEQPEMG
jgi:hypothetical protein